MGTSGLGTSSRAATTAPAQTLPDPQPSWPPSFATKQPKVIVTLVYKHPTGVPVPPAVQEVLRAFTLGTATSQPAPTVIALADVAWGQADLAAAPPGAAACDAVPGPWVSASVSVSTDSAIQAGNVQQKLLNSLRFPATTTVSGEAVAGGHLRRARRLLGIAVDSRLMRACCQLPPCPPSPPAQLRSRLCLSFGRRRGTRPSWRIKWRWRAAQCFQPPQ